MPSLIAVSKIDHKCDLRVKFEHELSSGFLREKIQIVPIIVVLCLVVGFLKLWPAAPNTSTQCLIQSFMAISDLYALHLLQNMVFLPLLAYMGPFAGVCCIWFCPESFQNWHPGVRALEPTALSLSAEAESRSLTFRTRWTAHLLLIFPLCLGRRNRWWKQGVSERMPHQQWRRACAGDFKWLKASKVPRLPVLGQALSFCELG